MLAPIVVIHLNGMNFPISIGRTSLFQFLGGGGGIFHFYSNSNRAFCEQTMETLIRRHHLWRLICICAVCICPTKRFIWVKRLVSSRHLCIKRLVSSRYLCIKRLVSGRHLCIKRLVLSRHLCIKRLVLSRYLP